MARMPFLASEKILIDPAHGMVILPLNEDSKEDDVAENYDDNGEDFDCVVVETLLLA
jgi:hypothetical protein